MVSSASEAGAENLGVTYVDPSVQVYGEGGFAVTDDFEGHMSLLAQKSLLRFLTCGSVDDGKSTLIGRLLYDTKLVFEDQLVALEQDSRKHGTTGDDVDFALLVDGLEAEREQGITIDVAYRFFTTEKRKFIVADTPGHEQYTRNMATGASTADLAIVLIDARRGILTQTRRHSFIASLLGIRHIVLAVNKMDLVGFSEAEFVRIRDEYLTLAKVLGFSSVVAIPMSARYGDNITSKSERTPWYEGRTLLDHLETIDIEDCAFRKPFRFPVQSVCRPNLDFRGFAGQVASGVVAVGDTVVIANSGVSTAIRRIVTMGYDGKDHDLQVVREGQSVTLVLADDVDCSRGDMLARVDERPLIADQFACKLIWFSEQPLFPGRTYILRTETQSVNVTVTELKHRIDVNTFGEIAVKSLKMNDIARCNIATSQPITCDVYEENRATGSFILIDRLTNATVAAGMIDFSLRRAANIHWQSILVDRVAHANQKNQRPAVLWFTGLSGSGKSTIANLVEKRLHAEGRHTFILDGDNVRHGLNRDLGFTDADRVENIRRIAEVARLMSDAGLIVLVSFISPFRAERYLARQTMAEGEFVEIYVDTPLDECAKRDPKGLYKKAREGQIKNFTGIDSPYEPPTDPEVHVKTLGFSPESLADQVCDFLNQRISNERTER